MDFTPPWVRAEVAKAQAFIDHAWAEHVHDTEHVLAPDWQLGPETILYNSIGDIVLVHIECRYCRIDALTRSLRPYVSDPSTPMGAEYQRLTNNPEGTT